MKKWFITIAAAMPLLAQDPTVPICNRTMVPVAMATVSKLSTGWRTKGWYHLDPGKCQSFDRGSGRFYVRAEAKRSLSEYAFGRQLLWGASESAISAAVESRVFDEAYSRTGDVRSFIPVERSLDLVDPEEAATLEDAAKRYEELVGLFDWRWDMREATSMPYRLGVTCHTPRDGVGLHVDKVYGGTPASLALRSGDRILAINGREIRSCNDLIEAVNENGFAYAPSARELRFAVLREGQQLLGSLRGPGAMLYVAHADDRKTDKERVEAILTFGWDALTLSFGAQTRCVAAGLAAAAGDSAFDYRQCLDQARSRYEHLAERYPELILPAELGGSIIGPSPLYGASRLIFGRAGRLGSAIAREALASTVEFAFVQYRHDREIRLEDLLAVTATTAAFRSAIR